MFLIVVLSNMCYNNQIRITYQIIICLYTHAETTLREYWKQLDQQQQAMFRRVQIMHRDATSCYLETFVYESTQKTEILVKLSEV